MSTFPLHPICEAALAAKPYLAYLWDLSIPVRPPTQAEVTEYGRRHTDPAWHDLYRFAAYTGHVYPPAAESLPAAGDVADRIGAAMAGYAAETGAEPVSDGPADTDAAGLEETPAAPAETSVMPAVEEHTEVIQAVTEGGGQA